MPQLFVATGATKWNDPKNFPWTMGLQPNYQSEARIYAKYILKENPNGKIAVLYQNDDFGKDYLKGLKDGLGDKANSHDRRRGGYEVSQPTIDSQIVKMKIRAPTSSSTSPRRSSRRRRSRRWARSNWKPMHFLNNVSTSIGAVIKPAGLEFGKASSRRPI